MVPRSPRASRAASGFLLRFLAASLVWLVPGCSDEYTIPDTTPPSSITDLSVEAYTSDGVALRWTAPGDDGSLGQARWYDIRYTTGDLAASWDLADREPEPLSPAHAGNREQWVVRGLAPGSWQFGIRAGDDVPLWSGMSNIATFTLVAEDTIPPGAVSDLAVVSFTRTSATLEWTAPGGDGDSGQAAVYRLRYAGEPIVDEWGWEHANPVEGIPPPAASGARETYTVTGLQAPGEYAFALRAFDAKGNPSGLSNTPTVALTLDSPFQLTSSSNYLGAHSPDWSPDGSKIAYIAGHEFSAETIRPQIYVVDAGGGEPVRYTSFLPEGAGTPSWSPDGTRFAFNKFVTDGVYTWGALAVMDASPGADFQILMDHGRGASVGQVAWSPDGASLAYVVNKGTPPGPFLSDLYTIPPSGGTPTPILQDVTLAFFSWSPDATRIVYSIREDGVYNLRILTPAGGTSVPLTEGAEDKTGPGWASTDEIAYLSGGTIWILPASGGTPRIGTSDAGALYGPLAWSPDGSKIAYAKLSGRLDVWITPIE